MLVGVHDLAVRQRHFCCATFGVCLDTAFSCYAAGTDVELLDSFMLSFLSLLFIPAGLINWRPYMPRLLNQLQWAFQVPVGTASATPPFSMSMHSVIHSFIHVLTHRFLPLQYEVVY